MRVLRLIALVAAALILVNPSASRAQPVGSQPYVWRNVTIGGGGFVTGLLFHPREKNLLYARTDVGGAYRSDDAGRHWIPITDWIGEMDFTGIESFAVDPMDANRIYLAAGIYSQTRAAILRSTDRGRTWQQTEVPFKMGGNEAGRFNGERLAVDPHDGKILFFGSRRDGLWGSGDHGASWNKIEGFPQIETIDAPEISARTNGQRSWGNFRPQAVGIIFVQFDSRSGEPGTPTPMIYAGVSTTGTNFFRSNDGGKTWAPVPGQPLGLRPNHAVLSPDGTVYLSYGRESGPNTMTDGAVWKFQPATSVWTDITPVKPPDRSRPISPDQSQPFGYGAVAVDAQRPSNIVVTTFGHWHPHDEIFRSTDGGASWVALLKNAQWDYSNAPYTESRTPHWMGSIQIDPFDSNHVLFTTGYGIWNCNNLTDAAEEKPTRWDFASAGFEETVPLAIVSPPDGAHLLSGLGDIDGFRHDDLDASPASGTFAGPRFSNTEDLAFAGRNPSIIVRTGTGGDGVHAAISTDGGKTWTALLGEPNGFRRGGGTIAVSADGARIVWELRGSESHVSSDGGAHWTVCAGIAAGSRVIADTVNSLRFYSFDARSGKILASTNGATSFFETGAALAETIGGEFRGNSTLSATPGMEGDLWLTLSDRGLYHLTNGGASFVKLDAVKDARAFGFGKPAEGKTFPAFYLVGKIENVTGLFRSADLGASWVRINDDQHQFGVIHHLTGDPRIFGRVYLATSGRGIIYGNPLLDANLRAGAH
jgi:photosystem II stability/assembly factor-like uncharacterized protein